MKKFILCQFRFLKFLLGCPNGSFQCKNGQCVPEYEFCNSNPVCLDKSDEDVEVCGSPIDGKDLRTVLDGQTCPFRCKNGRCRSTAIMCSGRDGCGDNSDELNCRACRKPVHYLHSIPSFGAVTINASISF